VILPTRIYTRAAGNTVRERRAPIGPAVARVLGVVALARGAQFVEVLLFPLVAATRGVDTVGAALVLLCLALGTTAGSLAGGMLVDRSEARRIAGGALALSSIAAFALALGDTVPIFGAAAGLYGAASAVWRLALETATAQALATDPGAVDPQAARERAFGAFIWLVNIGALVSALAVATGIGPRIGVALQAVLLGGAAVMALMLLRPTPVRAGGRRGSAGSLRPFLVFAFACAPFTIVTFQAFSGLAALFDDGEYRVAVLVNAVTLVVFPIVLWRVVSRIDGLRAILLGAGLQGSGMAVAAGIEDPTFAIILFSSGQAMLLGVLPAVVAGVAPHPAAGRYRAAFSTVQGAAAAGAIFAGPLIAAASATLFALTIMTATAVGLAAVLTQRAVVDLGLRQPVACPCGALLCTCGADHLSCAFPSPIMARPAARTAG